MAYRGSRWIFLLPIVGLALVLALAWQGFSSAREHRRAAESVLRDYAELGADEFVRRSANEVGYYGFYPLIVALGEGLNDPQVPLSSVSQILEGAGDRAAQQGDLISRAFRLQANATVELTSADPHFEAALSHWLADLPAPGDSPYAVKYLTIGSAGRLLVYRQDAGSVVGFEVDRQALATRLGNAFDRGPLLPASLGRPNQDRQPLTLSIRDPLGDLVTRLGQEPTPDDDPYANQLSMTVPYGDTYQGVLEGYSASVTLDPSAAGDLVIGGLPASRLPMVAILAVLATGFLVATIWLTRKEREMALLRTDFIARVSHELRTPLTQIRIFAETLLLRRMPQPADQQRALTIIDREARRLSHLVDNILRFSRGARGTALNPTPRPLAPLLEQIIERIRPLITDQTLVLENLLPDDLQVSVDSDALHQIVLNLLDNAIKYGPLEQSITLGWRPAGHVVQLSVSDQGPGVPETERDRVWENFQRLQRSAEKAIAGTGIGLSVVRELVDLHGGRAWVEDATGGGARFVVELPVVGIPVVELQAAEPGPEGGS